MLRNVDLGIKQDSRFPGSVTEQPCDLGQVALPPDLRLLVDKTGGTELSLIGQWKIKQDLVSEVSHRALGP